ncbi:hypothetical protein EfmE1679_1403 [Enterococcus faecium E1679]|nr:hypothetical protein EfmE1679_1403 [Enterococcus faecium E1679]
MGFRKNDNHQLDLLEGYFCKYLIKQRKVFGNSWAKPFHSIVFSIVNESRF